MNSEHPITLAVHAMATRFELVLYGGDPSRLRAAGEEALEEVEALDRQLSFYRRGSDVNWINSRAGGGPVKVEPRLFGLLKTAAELWELTDGAFDVTVAPLMRVWGLAGGEGRVPSDAEIAEALEMVGMGRVVLDEEGFTVRFEREGMLIDLGAIGKGYAIDRAVETLRESGVESALIHGGTSTIYGLGSPPNADAWRVAIRDPSGSGEWQRPGAVELRDSSLSVSAVHGKSFVYDGQEYGHVIDPRTGRPSRGAALAAVWGPSATETDALSTALLVLGEPGLEAVRGRGGDYSGVWESNRFDIDKQAD